MSYDLGQVQYIRILTLAIFPLVILNIRLYAW